MSLFNTSFSYYFFWGGDVDGLVVQRAFLRTKKHELMIWSHNWIQQINQNILDLLNLKLGFRINY